MLVFAGRVSILIIHHLGDVQLGIEINVFKQQAPLRRIQVGRYSPKLGPQLFPALFADIVAQGDGTSQRSVCRRSRWDRYKDRVAEA